MKPFHPGTLETNVIDVDAVVQSQFLSLYCMILADGIIDVKELEVLYRIGSEQYGLDATEITKAVRDSGSSFIVPAALDDKVQLLYNLAQIAVADGNVDDSEREIMKKYISRVGFLEENADGIAQFLFDAAFKNLSLSEVLEQLK